MVSLFGELEVICKVAFLQKLIDVPSLQVLLPLVRALYASESRFLWTDDSGEVHIIRQAEGGEQGCPLMPALFALAQHDALVEADGQLLPDECILSFLDDLYIKTTSCRAATATTTVTEAVERRASIRTNLGKLQTWTSNGQQPPRFAPQTTESPKGMKMLGTPKKQLEIHFRSVMEA